MGRTIRTEDRSSEKFLQELKKIQKGRMKEQTGGKPLRKKDGQQDIAGKKTEIEQKMFFSDMAYFMGHDPL